VVTRVDRLARSTRDLLNVLDRLGKADVGFKSLRETSVDTTSPQGRLVVNILFNGGECLGQRAGVAPGNVLAPGPLRSRRADGQRRYG
jgi:Resolvase, N terminal domain